MQQRGHDPGVGRWRAWRHGGELEWEEEEEAALGGEAPLRGEGLWRRACVGNEGQGKEEAYVKSLAACGGLVAGGAMSQEM